MSVNSFEHYPMTWKPDKNLLKTPLYLCLAELLEQDIVNRTSAYRHTASTTTRAG